MDHEILLVNSRVLLSWLLIGPIYMGSISSSIYSRKLAAKADEKYVATQQQ